MEALISIVWILFSLFVAVLSVRLAAGWLDAEHTGWGRCLGAILLSYLALVALIAIGAGAMGVMQNLAGVLVLIAAIIGALFAALLIYSRVLGTSKVRALGIMVISMVVSMALTFVIGFALTLVFGAGLAGMMGMGGLSALLGGGGSESADESLAGIEVRIEQMCACPDEQCVEAIMPELMGELMSASMSIAMQGGDPETDPRLSAIVSRMETCEPQGDIAIAEAGPAVETTPAIDAEPPTRVQTRPVEAPDTMTSSSPPAREPSPAVRQAPRELRGPLVPYAMREVDVASAAGHIGKLVRITRASGERFADQLVGLGVGVLVLKRDRSAGGERYEVELDDVARFEVFDQG